MLCRLSTTTLLLFALLVGGCERAQRYPAVPSSPPTPTSAVKEDVKPPPVPPHYGWQDGAVRPDVPIQFVAEDTSPEHWRALQDYWTASPSPFGIRTLTLGLAPLEATVAVGALRGIQSIKIKVPRGLPDPTPLIPSANPPTLGKWILGKRLFFDDQLLKMSPTLTRSCADCHDPAQAFALNAVKPASGKRNVPSLLNSVYNRHQFWDGRVDALEQVLLRQLDDERESDKNQDLDQSPGYLHVWPGLVKRLGGKPEYLQAFDMVFGADPTADSIAKALATYLRTLLSGNSLVDMATQHQKQRGDSAMKAQDFEPFLSPKVLDQLPSTLSVNETAKELAHGAELFHGKARCQVCHPAPLFTDHGFHNIGVGESAGFANPGKEPGRFSYLAFGLKDRRLIGAFKTPSLRNVSLTAPYMHDGTIASLGEVLSYFNDGLKADGSGYLDAELMLEPDHARKLYMNTQDLAALELYLRALRGEELPAAMTAVPKR
jgi:cytochrome c peroxidase